MKYTTEVIVNIPRHDFIVKMDQAENMKHWQRGFVGYKLLSAIQGEQGSKMELRYKMGKREITMVETILKSNFPDEFQATYDAKGVHNIQKNSFVDIDGRSTKWVSENEFHFSGLMMKVMGFFMPGAFKKQSLKYLQDFKAFAENGTSVIGA